MIYIGTSGFSFDDWRGDVYPATLKKSEWLGFYERELGFSALEINMTYYRLPSPSVFASMSRRTSTTFQFIVKAHKDMTHNLRDQATGKLRDTMPVFEKFISCVEPLRQEGKLACVLLQFPYAFTPVPEHCDYLNRARDMLAPLPLVVEFRNSRWNNNATIALLRNSGIGYCAVDEPQLPGLMPFVPVCTSTIGYVRLHGRNTQWFRAPASERYNYRYTHEELRGFCEPIKKMASVSQQMFVFFNNCHAGHAAHNARELAQMLLESGSPQQMPTD